MKKEGATTRSTLTERSAWLIPPGALDARQRLTAVVEGIGAVPCRTSDVEAWPDRSQEDQPPARMAVKACEFCPARQECLDYALAADERYGIWAGTLPAERRAMRRRAA